MKAEGRCLTPGRERARQLACTALVAVGALVLTSCGEQPAADGGSVAEVSGPTSSTGLRGTELPDPVALDPAVAQLVLSSSAGGQTTLASLQEGKVMLLYFGYTYCPDVCPTTLANVALALRQAPVEVQRRVQVVMVSADPERDTPEALSNYLAYFDGGLPTRFVGLTGSLEQVQGLGAALGVEMTDPEVLADGTVNVDHGAQVMGFVGGEADVLWLGGTTSADYAHDIEELAAALPR